MRTMYKYLGYLLTLLMLLSIGCEDFSEPVDDMLKSAEQKQNNSKKLVELTDDEIDGLLFMREEEKLAHDVYYEMYQLYQHNIFLNICDSEQKHTDAILRLLNFYELNDPAEGKAVGEFENTELQALYNLLIIEGGQGIISALEVGVLIEETDITDIEALKAQTEVKNILQVYDHLLQGSARHLNAFEKVLDKVESKLN